MSAVKRLPTVTRCLKCQRHTLNAFLGLAGLSIRPCATAHLQPSRLMPSRPYSLPTKSSYETEPDQTSELSESASTIVEAEEPSEHTSNNTEDVPWYLEEETQEPISPLAERQKLPDIPENAPENLQDIVQHLSIDIGLDYLRLLDLRDLDPPPALGTGLIMILGTARSEKHLHVSADRFCRWLRSKYKLSPNPDGLLGRNELKLKLRRRAKRAKLLGSVGTDKAADSNDGIRTGWVCVDAGVIQRGSRHEQSLEDEGIIGFGGIDSSVRLVVQMLTEDKRHEMDLETLWDKALARQERKEMREAAEREILLKSSTLEASENDKVGLTDQPLQHIANAMDSAANRNHKSYNPIQRRNFSSSTRAYESDSKERPNPRLTTHFLEMLRQSSKVDMNTKLGKSPDNSDKTSFLRDFYKSLPPSTVADHWRYRMELVAIGIEHGQDGYTEQHLENLLSKMGRAIKAIPLSCFEFVIDTIVKASYRSFAQHDRHLQNMKLTISIFSDLWLRKLEISPSIIQNLFTISILAQPPLADSQLGQYRFTELIEMNRLWVSEPERHVQILDLLARTNDWEGYWKFWRMIARRREARSWELYTLMFMHVANSNHQRRCIEAIEEWLPVMRLENPPVTLSAHLAEALKMCLKVIDPAIETQIQAGKDDNGQWYELWRKCESVIQQQE
jgi:hypothetical protein